MKKVELTAFELAERFVGVKEVPGTAANPQILAMLNLDQAEFVGDDEVPWCSAFTNYIAWLLRLPRSKKLSARSWLLAGEPIQIDAALVGFDVVVLSRGQGPQPGPEVINAPGHVGFYAGLEGPEILVLGGNQSDEVGIGRYQKATVLGIRRLRS